MKKNIIKTTVFFLIQAFLTFNCLPQYADAGNCNQNQKINSLVLSNLSPSLNLSLSSIHNVYNNYFYPNLTYKTTRQLIRELKKALPSSLSSKQKWSYSGRIIQALKKQAKKNKDLEVIVVAGKNFDARNHDSISIDYQCEGNESAKNFCVQLQKFFPVYKTLNLFNFIRKIIKVGFVPESLLRGVRHWDKRERELYFLISLLQNMRHLESGLSIIIREKVKDEYVKLSVIDNGPGFINKKGAYIPIDAAIEYNKSFGKNKGIGLGLTAAVTQFSDISVINQPKETKIILPGLKGIVSRVTLPWMVFGLAFLGANISLAGVITLGILPEIIRILKHKNDFKQFKFTTKNMQGTIVTGYFYYGWGRLKSWRKRLQQKLAREIYEKNHAVKDKLSNIAYEPIRNLSDVRFISENNFSFKNKKRASDITTDLGSKHYNNLIALIRNYLPAQEIFWQQARLLEIGAGVSFYSSLRTKEISQMIHPEIESWMINDMFLGDEAAVNVLEGDFMRIMPLLKTESFRVILMSNMVYPLLNTLTILKRKKIKIIFENLNNILEPNAYLVIGELEEDLNNELGGYEKFIELAEEAGFNLIRQQDYPVDYQGYERGRGFIFQKDSGLKEIVDLEKRKLIKQTKNFVIDSRFMITLLLLQSGIFAGVPAFLKYRKKYTAEKQKTKLNKFLADSLLAISEKLKTIAVPQEQRIRLMNNFQYPEHWKKFISDMSDEELNYLADVYAANLRVLEEFSDKNLKGKSLRDYQMYKVMAARIKGEDWIRMYTELIKSNEKKPIVKRENRILNSLAAPATAAATLINNPMSKIQPIPNAVGMSIESGKDLIQSLEKQNLIAQAI